MALKDFLPSRLGFGAAPLGNMFRAIPEEESLATVEAAWKDGTPLIRQCPLLWRRPCVNPHGRSAQGQAAR